MVWGVPMVVTIPGAVMAVCLRKVELHTGVLVISQWFLLLRVIHSIISTNCFVVCSDV